MPHDHHHPSNHTHQPHSAVRGSVDWSLLRVSAAQRMMGAALLLALLWLATGWAVT